MRRWKSFNPLTVGAVRSAESVFEGTLSEAVVSIPSLSGQSVRPVRIPRPRWPDHGFNPLTVGAVRSA